MTDRELQAFYRDTNKRFFGNNLPALSVRFGKLDKITDLGRTRFVKTIPREIVISRRLRSKGFNTTACLTLIHEMAHVKLGRFPHCGFRDIAFNSEMLRLAEMGALSGLW